MRGLVGAILLLSGSASATQAQRSMNEITEAHDAEVRARNAESDFFFVSSVNDGLKQIRFYVDRNTIKDATPSRLARAWVDVYEAVDGKRPIRIQHSKFLEEVRCGDEPQMRIKTLVTYGLDGVPTTHTDNGALSDVIPGSSQETVYRFICASEPANAYYPVFNGNTPEKDAMNYYVRQAQ
ncbi:hypothetical protein QTN93_10565 [Sphingomonas aerolata]|uniref:hypothetical protein n=1 Tax=Sphingomonas aerolata TaxID=185951 RepID=UPI0035A6C50B